MHTYIQQIYVFTKDWQFNLSLDPLILFLEVMFVSYVARDAMVPSLLHI